jgi:hypothetical protein
MSSLLTLGETHTGLVLRVDGFKAGKSSKSKEEVEIPWQWLGCVDEPCLEERSLRRAK